MFYSIFKKQFFNIWDKIKKDELPKIAKIQPLKGTTYKDYKILSKEINTDYDIDFNIYSLTKINKNYPLIFDIHGGGWVYGDKELNKDFCFHLAANKFNVVSLTYPLLDDKKIHLDTQIQSIFKCLSYLKLHQNELNISMNNILLTGDSAGGELALLFATINQNKDMQLAYNVDHLDININCLVINHGVPYIDDAAKVIGHPILSKYVTTPGINHLLFGRFYKSKKIYQMANPNYYLNKNFTYPPILVITSKGDKEYAAISIKLAETLRDKNIYHELYVENSEKCLHVFNVAHPDSPEGIKANKKIVEFYKENIK